MAVSDLARSVAFYARVLGLALIWRDGQSATLGAGVEHPALALSALPDPTAASPHDTAATVRRVLGAGWHIDGASDHGVSEALYLSDPDGLGIEIYADRPRERWERPAAGDGVKMFTRPLDIEDLLAQAPDEPPQEIEPETVIGHVHLKVGDVGRASSFYHDVLGFSEQATLPSAAFLAADGYHHHIGLNSWQSLGAGAPPPTAPGLRLVEFTLGDADSLAQLERGIERAPGGPFEIRRERERLLLDDLDGNLLVFAAGTPSAA